MKNKLILQPSDYIVLHPGLRIENTSGNRVIEIDMPSIMTVKPVEYKVKEVKVSNNL